MGKEMMSYVEEISSRYIPYYRRRRKEITSYSYKRNIIYPYYRWRHNDYRIYKKIFLVVVGEISLIDIHMCWNNSRDEVCDSLGTLNLFPTSCKFIGVHLHIY